MKRLIIESHKTETHTFIYYLKHQTLDNNKVISENTICGFEQNPFDDCQTFSIKSIYSLFNYCNGQPDSKELFKNIIYKICAVICKKQFVFNLREDYDNVDEYLSYLNTEYFSKIHSNSYISTRNSKMLIGFYKVNKSLLYNQINIDIKYVYYARKSTN